jgi:hypothetical protein
MKTEQIRTKQINNILHEASSNNIYEQHKVSFKILIDEYTISKVLA